MTGWTGRRVALLALLMWLPLLVIAPTGLFLVDEVVQYASIVSFARDGSFVVENGYAEYGSADLKWPFLREGPNGLVAQYPFLFTVLASPFYLLAGMRGVFLLNLLGAFAALALTWKIAERLGDTRIALLSVIFLMIPSFLANYAVALWPHAISLGFGMAAIYCAVLAGTSAGVNVGTAVLGGFAMGAGVLIRTDIGLLLPALCIWLVLFADRPYAKILLAGAGVAPVLLLGSVVNQQKFGIFSPVTYGGGGGGTSISAHVPILAIVACVCALVLAWRHLPRYRVQIGGLGLVGLFLAIAVSPEIRNWALRLGTGLYLLLIDLTAHPAVGKQLGVERDAAGVVTFWTLHKKALFQSLPWVGLFPLLILARREVRPLLALCALVVVFNILPFAALSWHGGLAPNMRYFLFSLPLLCILLAIATDAAVGRSGGHPILALKHFAISALVLILFLQAMPLGERFVEHRLPVYLFLAALITSSVFVWLGERRVFPIVIALCLTTATVNGYAMDVRETFELRLRSQIVGEAYLSLVPRGSVLYDNYINAQWAMIERGDSLIAVSGQRLGEVDPEFVMRAALDGLPIVVRDPALANSIEEAIVPLEMTRTSLGGVTGEPVYSYTIIQPETE